jgi:hypothetical protein
MEKLPYYSQRQTTIGKISNLLGSPLRVAIIEQYSKITRFCIICNYHNKIIDPIISRCSLFRFKPIESNEIIRKLQYICTQENFNPSENILKKIVSICRGDLRKAINLLQKCYNSFGDKLNEELYYIQELKQSHGRYKHKVLRCVHSEVLSLEKINSMSCKIKLTPIFVAIATTIQIPAISLMKVLVSFCSTSNPYPTPIVQNSLKISILNTFAS